MVVILEKGVNFFPRPCTYVKCLLRLTLRVECYVAPVITMSVLSRAQLIIWRVCLEYVVQVHPCNYRIDCRSVLGRMTIKTEKSRGGATVADVLLRRDRVRFKKNQIFLRKKPPDKRLVQSRPTKHQVPLCFSLSDRQEIGSLQETIRHSLFPKPGCKQEFIRVVVSPK